MTKKKKKFKSQISRGRQFEQRERSQWTGPYNQSAEFEAQTIHQGKRGRIDIKLVDPEQGFTVVTEIKASDWDAMKPRRVRPNALRHANQLWRYIEAELEHFDVIPAVVYPKSPKTPGRKEEIFKILDDRGIQVVWRDEEYPLQ